MQSTTRKVKIGAGNRVLRRCVNQDSTIRNAGCFQGEEKKKKKANELCCNKNGLTKFQPNSRSWRTREGHADDGCFQYAKKNLE